MSTNRLNDKDRTARIPINGYYWCLSVLKADHRVPVQLLFIQNQVPPHTGTTYSHVPEKKRVAGGPEHVKLPAMVSGHRTGRGLVPGTHHQHLAAPRLGAGFFPLFGPTSSFLHPRAAAAAPRARSSAANSVQHFFMLFSPLVAQNW